MSQSRACVGCVYVAMALQKATKKTSGSELCCAEPRLPFSAWYITGHSGHDQRVSYAQRTAGNQPGFAIRRARLLRMRVSLQP